MNDAQIQEMEGCAQGSLSGTLTFPEVVGRLAAVGVERYHTDYSRQEITYYLTSGESQVVALPHPPAETGLEFVAEAVASAIRQSQANEHTYLEFVRKTMAAGCVGYFVQIAGRRRILLGARANRTSNCFRGRGAVTSGRQASGTKVDGTRNHRIR